MKYPKTAKLYFETVEEFLARKGKIIYCPPRSALGITGAPKKFLPDEEKVEKFVKKKLKKNKTKLGNKKVKNND